MQSADEVLLQNQTNLKDYDIGLETDEGSKGQEHVGVRHNQTLRHSPWQSSQQS